MKKDYIKPNTGVETIKLQIFASSIDPIPENAPRYNARGNSNTDSPIEDMTYESLF